MHVARRKLLELHLSRQRPVQPREGQESEQEQAVDVAVHGVTPQFTAGGEAASLGAGGGSCSKSSGAVRGSYASFGKHGTGSDRKESDTTTGCPSSCR